MNGKPWTPEEDQILKELYPYQNTDKIAASLGRKRFSVWQRAFALKLRKQQFPAGAERAKAKNAWSEEEFQFLKDHYMKWSFHHIAMKLGRSTAGVSGTAARLGLRKGNSTREKHKLKVL